MNVCTLIRRNIGITKLCGELKVHHWYFGYRTVTPNEVCQMGPLSWEHLFPVPLEVKSVHQKKSSQGTKVIT